ncbi:hypothetical protein BO70DRAFT_395946 [Aspergillus heteromorphus CBS 117.55]|uniref:SAGA-associated factor 11 n=1 Tax=Aspergillus heteromorphus CBS 117.55 TaxID=1448321 RepID=A0A317WAG1_9EURO|nr:uncharacterized protein BO70DRAFT_395946 [Aspergillus heteromorphus CBS 117.55]PWY83514.1 hypothetical protein BO70DRAFT_395946 [Aspergillus heteromorphus CBS 117.55]
MGESNGTEEHGSSLPPGTLAKLTCDILNDTFYNIIHDIVAKVHRDEKVARMRSAVVAARQKADEEATRRREESGKPAVAFKPGDLDLEELKDIHVETEAAVFEEGKVYLKGNPLQTTKEVICPDCRLPRLLYPSTGVGARPPPDPYREYCQKQPMISKPGHDVHGNPFATDKLNPKKKKQTNTSNTPASSPPTTPDSSFNKQAAPEKVSFPTVKCPNCPRYFVVTRVAQHLDRCLGLSGRQTNRNKTPMENGASTPTSAPPKRPLVDDDAPATLPKKKKLGAPKKLTSNKPPPPSKLKNGLTPDMAAASDAAGSGDVDIKSEANGDNA